MKQKPSILITRFPYESILSGEEWHTIKLAEKLRAKKYKNFLLSSCPILLKEFKKRKFPVKKTWLGTPIVTKTAVFKFIFTGWFYFLRAVYFLIYYRFKHKIKVLYCLSLNEKILMTPIARLLGIRVIWLEHARIGRWLRHNPFVVFYFLWSFLTKTIIFISKEQCEKMRGLPHRIHITNGIDLTEFKPKKKFKRNFKKPKNAILVGTLTRLYKDKGVDYFIKAADSVKREQKNVYFLVAGEGPEEKNLKKLIKDLKISKNCKILGHLSREKVINFLNEIDIFILPSSLHDPFGMVVAEAMACRKPVIVTEACGIIKTFTFKKSNVGARFIAPNNKHALIIPAADTKTIKNAVLELIKNPKKAQKLARNGYTLAKEKFSLERMVEEYEKQIF